MIKTILIIVISVTLFGWLFYIIVRNALKRKLDILVEEEKRKLNNPTFPLSYPAHCGMEFPKIMLHWMLKQHDDTTFS